MKREIFHDSDTLLISLFLSLFPRKAKRIFKSTWMISSEQTGHMLNSFQHSTQVNEQTIKFSKGSRNAA